MSSSDIQSHIQQKDAAIQAILREGGAEEIVKIDLKNRTALCDFMYISTGLSQRHIATLAEKIGQALKEIDKTFIPREGDGTDWNVIDGGDMIIHILTPQARERYRLEDLWSSDFDESGMQEAVHL